MISIFFGLVITFTELDDLKYAQQSLIVSLGPSHYDSWQQREVQQWRW